MFSYSLPKSSAMGLPELCLIFGWGSLHLLLSVPGWSFSDVENRPEITCIFVHECWTNCKALVIFLCRENNAKLQYDNKNLSSAFDTAELTSYPHFHRKTKQKIKNPANLGVCKRGNNFWSIETLEKRHNSDIEL